LRGGRLHPRLELAAHRGRELGAERALVRGEERRRAVRADRARDERVFLRRLALGSSALGALDGRRERPLAEQSRDDRERLRRPPRDERLGRAPERRLDVERDERALRARRARRARLARVV